MENTDAPRTPTVAQINANRENAKKSTGPRSVQGKDASSRNGLTHGLSGNRHTLLGENPEEFVLLLKHLYDGFRPVGLGEEKLVHRIANAQWRLDRAFFMEAGIFRQCLERVDARDYSRKRELENHKINHARSPEQYCPPPPPPDPGDRTVRAFNNDCDHQNHLHKLARYETTIERSIDRCLRQLKTFQAARNAADPSPQPPVGHASTPAPAPQTRPADPPLEVPFAAQNKNYEANPKNGGTAPPPMGQASTPAPAPQTRPAGPPPEVPSAAQNENYEANPKKGGMAPSPNEGGHANPDPLPEEPIEKVPQHDT